MTNKEIFKRSIEKARKNGWRWPVGMATQKHIFSWSETYNESGYTQILINGILTSQDFAKAFFGERLMEINLSTETTLRLRKVPEWQDCLQQMVLEKEQLKYIENFL